MKKVVFAAATACCILNTCVANVGLITDPSSVTTASIGFVANAVPEHIMTNDGGLVFALCVNYLMVEDRGPVMERFAKFAAAYIAGAVLGRVCKEAHKTQGKTQAGSPKVSAEADAWAAQ